MPTFYLQQDLKEQRRVITTDDDMRSDFRITLSTCEAESWLEAKCIFCGEEALTELQKELLPLDAEARALVLSRERWYGFGGAVFGLKEQHGLLKGHHTKNGWSYGH